MKSKIHDPALNNEPILVKIMDYIPDKIKSELFAFLLTITIAN